MKPPKKQKEELKKFQILMNNAQALTTVMEMEITTETKDELYLIQQLQIDKAIQIIKTIKPNGTI